MDKNFFNSNTIEVFSPDDLEVIQMTIERLGVSEDLKDHIIQSWQNILERLKGETWSEVASFLRKEEIIEEIDRISEENRKGSEHGKSVEDAMDKLREIITGLSGEQVPVVNKPESE